MSKPILTALAKFYQTHGRPPEGEELLALTSGIAPAAAAPINSAGPMPSAAAIASEIVTAQAAAAAASKFLTKAEFDQLSSQAKGDFFRSGGRLVEGPPAPARKSSTPGVKHRAEFNELSPQGRMDFMRSGGKLID